MLIELTEDMVTIEYFHPLSAGATRTVTTPDPMVPIDLWNQFDPVPLPPGLLPEAIENFALEESRLMGADAGGLALGALAVCAAVISDRIQLQVKQYNKGWTKSARIWVGLIGYPSMKKLRSSIG